MTQIAHLVMAAQAVKLASAFPGMLGKPYP